MKQKVKERTEKPAAEDGCHHFWDIEVANGSKSRGVCKYCGEKRDFLNAFPVFNPLKRNSNPLSLPELPVVEIDKDSKS